MFIVNIDFLVHEDCIDDFHAAILTQASNSLEREQDCLRFDELSSPWVISKTVDTRKESKEKQKGA